MSPNLHSVKDDKSANSEFLDSQLKSTLKGGLVDDALDSNRSGSYHLSLELSAWTVSFCVLDTLSNKYLALHQESVIGEGIDGAVAHLLQMRQTNELLSPEYKSISLVLVNEQFTTVPAPLYVKSKERTLLKFNNEGFQLQNQEYEVLVDKLKGVEAYNLYAISLDALVNLRAAFKGIKIVHHTTSLVDTLFSLYKNQNREHCFLHIQKGLFSIVVIKGNDLRFCNNFLYSSKEDLAYYTLFVCEQLKLNPESVNVVILGECGKNSPEYDILYTYIRNLSFIERNRGFAYSYKMDSDPGHYHFNLFSHYHCV